MKHTEKVKDHTSLKSCLKSYFLYFINEVLVASDDFQKNDK